MAEARVCTSDQNQTGPNKEMSTKQRRPNLREELVEALDAAAGVQPLGRRPAAQRPQLAHQQRRCSSTRASQATAVRGQRESEGAGEGAAAVGSRALGHLSPYQPHRGSLESSRWVSGCCRRRAQMAS